MLKFSLTILLSVAIAGLTGNCTSKTAPVSVDDESASLAVNSPGKDWDENQNDGSIIWLGSVGQTSLVWSTADIYLASRNKKESLFSSSFAKFENSERKKASANLRSNKDSLNNEFLRNRESLELKSDADITIKSVVGSIVTFEISYRSVLEGSPGATDTWWLSLDLSKSGNIEPFNSDGENPDSERTIGLNEIFSQDDLITAVMENPKIRSSLSEQQRQQSPASLKDLLENEGKNKDNPRIEVGEGNYLTSDSFNHFVFDRIENGKVVVKLAVFRFAETNHYKNDYIEISLSIPDKYKVQITGAESRSQGFLGKDSDRISNGRNTTFSIKTMVPLPHRVR